MDDNEQQFEDDGQVATEAKPESRDIRLLREKAEKYDSTVTERDLYKRELEFFKVGIPDTPQTKWFRKGYDGELTPEAIRAAAAESGLIEIEAPEQDEDEQAHERIAAASNGASTSSTANVTPATYAAWPREKRLAFMQAHPDLTDALGRGESVKLPAAS